MYERNDMLAQRQAEQARIQKEEIQQIQDSLKNLAEISFNLALTKFALKRNMAKDTITNHTINLRNSLYNAAEKYGQKLESNATRYNNTRAEVDKITSDYEKALGEITQTYIEAEKANTLKSQKLEATKEDVYAKLATARMNRDDFIAEHLPELQKQVEPLKAQQKELMDNVSFAIACGNTEEANRYMESIKTLQAKQTELEDPYNEALAPFDEELTKSQEDVTKLQLQLQMCEENSAKFQQTHDEACTNALGNKEELLAKVEGNKMFDKLKGFLSKTALGRINGAKNFKQNYLIPAKEKVAEFAEAVPEKVSQLRGKFDGIVSKGREIATNTIDDVKQDISDTKATLHFALNAVKNRTGEGMYTLASKLQEKADILMEQNVPENSTVYVLEDNAVTVKDSPNLSTPSTYDDMNI